MGFVTKSVGILILTIHFIPLLHAQTSTNITGGNLTGTTGSISYSVGQINFQQQVGPDNHISEGVQQSYSIEVINDHSDFNVGIYPNPTSGDLHIQLDKIMAGITIQLYDYNGLEISNMTLEDTNHILDLQHLPSAVYMLKFIVEGSEQKVYKIIKR